MPLILGTNSIKDTGFNVSNSLRFNDGSSDYLNRTQSSGSRRTFTISTWFKRATLGSNQELLGFAKATNLNMEYKLKSSTDVVRFYSYNGSSTTANFTTDRVFRDVSSWYHFVLSIDTTQSTEANRMKFYVNGVQETSFSAITYPSLNEDLQINHGESIAVGAFPSGSDYFDGYMTEVVLIDGQALDPTSFGEFDSDSPTIWKPKNVSGLTFGDNGFYLQFKESGTSQNSSGLGADTSGNGNHFAVNNLTAVDQSTDTCTNNFATMNSLDNYYASSTFAEGNLKITTNASNQTFNTGTIGLSTGKWYFEAKLVQAGGEESIGITDIVSTGTGIYGGKTANSYSFKGNNGDIRNNDSNSSYGSAYAQDSIVSVFIDLDNNKLYFAIDGTLQNSGTGHSITAPASTTNGVYFPMVGDVDTDSVIWECNFGSPSFAISSGNTDGEYGNFEYSTTITGDGASKTFKAINTKNLAEFG